MARSTSPSQIEPRSTGPAQESNTRKPHEPSIDREGKHKRTEICGSHANKAPPQSHPPVQARQDGPLPARWAIEEKTERPPTAKPAQAQSPAEIAGPPPGTLPLPEFPLYERSSSPAMYAVWRSPRERRSRQNRSPKDSPQETQHPPHPRAVHAEIRVVQEEYLLAHSFR